MNISIILILSIKKTKAYGSWITLPRSKLESAELALSPGCLTPKESLSFTVLQHSFNTMLTLALLHFPHLYIYSVLFSFSTEHCLFILDSKLMVIIQQWACCLSTICIICSSYPVLFILLGKIFDLSKCHNY